MTIVSLIEDIKRAVADIEIALDGGDKEQIGDFALTLEELARELQEKTA